MVGRDGELGGPQTDGIAQPRQRVTDVRHIVLRLDPDTAGLADRRAPAPQRLDIDALRARILRTGESERHGPGRLVARDGEQGGTHLLGVQELGPLRRCRGTEFEGDAMTSCVGDEAGEAAWWSRCRGPRAARA